MGVVGMVIPLLVMVLDMVGMPGEGIALVLGVDRILDMARTVPNVTGHLLASIVITRSEWLPLVVRRGRRNGQGLKGGRRQGGKGRVRAGSGTVGACHPERSEGSAVGVSALAMDPSIVPPRG